MTITPPKTSNCLSVKVPHLAFVLGSGGGGGDVDRCEQFGGFDGGCRRSLLTVNLHVCHDGRDDRSLFGG